jgi:hypothetical protein
VERALRSVRCPFVCLLGLSDVSDTDCFCGSGEDAMFEKVVSGCSFNTVVASASP